MSVVVDILCGGTPKGESNQGEACTVTPQPGTRRGVKRGCHTSRLGLFNLLFLRADTCIHMHNLYNNKNNSFYIYIIHTTIAAFIIFYTYTRVPLLVLLQFHYYKTIHIKSEITKYCGEHLSLRWPVLLMWDVLSSILVFCFCTYTD